MGLRKKEQANALGFPKHKYVHQDLELILLAQYLMEHHFV